MLHRGIIWHIILLGVNFLLLLWIFQIWWNPEGALSPDASPKKLALPPTPLSRDMQPLTAFKVIAAKNLFTSSRREAVKAEASKPSKDELEKGYLIGTIIVGDGRAALVGLKEQGAHKPEQVQVVHVGESWQGYKIIEITVKGIVLVGEGGTKTLSFPEPDVDLKKLKQ